MRALAPKYLRTLLHESETVGPVVQAIVVGLLGGVAAILFEVLMGLTHRFFFEAGSGPRVPFDLHVIFLPALGLLVVGLLASRYAPEIEGTGIPRVMYAIRKQGGRIRYRVGPLKALASLACIGTGGSLGREGPIVYLGASLGSAIAQLLNLRDQRVQLLAAFGAASAIGANFNAPIAGAMFALEVVLGNFRGRDFGLVVVASVSGTALSQAVLGQAPAFELLEPFRLLSAKELPLYLVLGLLAGLLALGVKRVVYGFVDLSGTWSAPRWQKNLAGGLLVGLIGWIGIRLLGGPYLFGVGYDGIERALALTEAPTGWSVAPLLVVLISLLVLKLLATSFTLAGGGSGGIFAPSLFLGAMLGGVFGAVAGQLFGSGIAPPGAYALVGMGAVFAGVAHAPITSVIILFEMSGNYQIILPLMLAVGVSYLFTSRLGAESFYGVKLRRLGGLAPEAPEASVLDLFLVADAMVTRWQAVGPDTPFSELAVELHQEPSRGLPVLDGEGRLRGLVTTSDLWTALTQEGSTERLTASDVMTRDLVTCRPHESLREVLRRLEEQELSQVVVVSREDPERLVGILRREEIFWAFGEMMSEHGRMLGGGKLELPEDAVQLAVQVQPGHRQVAFRRIRELGLPTGVLVAVLRRGDRPMVPSGETVVEPGDVLVLLTTRHAEPALQAWLGAL